MGRRRSIIGFLSNMMEIPTVPRYTFSSIMSSLPFINVQNWIWYKYTNLTQQVSISFFFLIDSIIWKNLELKTQIGKSNIISKFRSFCPNILPVLSIIFLISTSLDRSPTQRWQGFWRSSREAWGQRSKNVRRRRFQILGSQAWHSHNGWGRTEKTRSGCEEAV